MSYDLTFWKQKPSCKTPPAEVYSRLMDGLVVADLELLPVEAIETMIDQRFPGVVRAPGLTYWEGGDRGMFEIYVTEQHIHFCCRQLWPDGMSLLHNVDWEDTWCRQRCYAGGTRPATC